MLLFSKHNHQSLSLSPLLSAWTKFMIMLIIFVFSILFCHGVSRNLRVGFVGKGVRVFQPPDFKGRFQALWNGSLIRRGESTNWNMQQIQCMVEIWGDLPIRTHSLGWCHIRWPLFSRNWKMIFPKACFFFLVEYVTSFPGREGVCWGRYSWIDRFSGYMRVSHVLPNINIL